MRRKKKTLNELRRAHQHSLRSILWFAYILGQASRKELRYISMMLGAVVHIHNARIEADDYTIHTGVYTGSANKFKAKIAISYVMLGYKHT